MDTDDKSWFMCEVRKEHARLRAFVRSLGVRIDSVDDIAQEAFVVAWEKRAQFQRGSNFSAWVREISRGIIRNEFRKAQRRQRIIDDMLSQELLEASISYETPDSQLAQQDRFESLHSCLAEVPENGRELLRMRYFEDLRPTVIAARLGRSSNQVRQTLLRLRRGLLSCLRQRSGAL
jgi:RNA polymerase sigma-70 factor, ECF subfamily